MNSLRLGMPTGKPRFFFFKLEPDPAPGEPGTLRQQLAAVGHFLSLDDEIVAADPVAAWEAARWATIPHERRVVA